jgi:DegV family protein with EDD domain
VIAAARAREKGADLDKIVAAAEAVRSRTAVMLTVDTLTFLHRGGRIGGAAMMIGTALDIKPQLIVDSVTGLVVAGARTRTRRKAVDATYRAFFARMDTSKPMHIGVHHAEALDECEALVARVKSDYPTAEVVTNEITPVLGTHGGPGTLALCGYYEE